MDHAIDQFHIILGFDRFNRPEFPNYQSNFDVQVDGVKRLVDNSASDISNLKYKLKFWPWQWRGNPGQCPCGFSLNAQVKIPIGSPSRGQTTGNFDYSLGWHLGFPIFEKSAIWLSSFVTYTNKNPLLEDWPRRIWHQTDELASDWAITDNWGILFTVRMESPILEKEKLSIVNAESDPKQKLLDRIASGWNSLVHWRGSESLGIRWQSDDATQKVNVHFVEDWAVGHFDVIGDDFYINNAPDFVIGLQYSQTFE